MAAEADLILPRRLAIQILHEAQIAQPESICGVVGARNGQPQSFLRAGAEALDARGEALWAQLWSNPAAPAIPDAQDLQAGGLHLVVSLDTKGVLELRAWELRDGTPHERVIKARD